MKILSDVINKNLMPASLLTKDPFFLVAEFDREDGYKQSLNFAPPETGMSIVKSVIEKTIKQEVKDFDIIYKQEEKIIDLRLYDYTDDNNIFHEKLVVKYTEGETLCGIIHNMLKKHTSTNAKISYAIVNYKTMLCTLLINKEGNKIKQEIKL